MKVLITGGAGFIGSHLVEHFLKETDWEIIVLDKLTYASQGFEWTIKPENSKWLNL